MQRKEEPSLLDVVVGREAEQECEIAGRFRRFRVRHGLAHGALELLPGELRRIGGENPARISNEKRKCLVAGLLPVRQAATAERPSALTCNERGPLVTQARLADAWWSDDRHEMGAAFRARPRPE